MSVGKPFSEPYGTLAGLRRLRAWIFARDASPRRSSS